MSKSTHGRSVKSQEKIVRCKIRDSEGMYRSRAIGIQGVHEWHGHTCRSVPWTVLRGDVEKVLSTLSEEVFDCVITSPPYYWQRDYKVEGQLGLEKTIQEYVTRLADAMSQVKRVLRKQGLLFLNLGDTYYSAKGQPKGNDKKNNARRFGLRAVDASGLGVPRKTSIGIPWRVALELIARGWVLRCPIVWRRVSTQPEPTAKDRPWRTYEMIFMFSKSPRYHFERDRLNGEEDIWTISERPNKARGIHTAAFPDKLAHRCLEIGCPPGGHVLDPFAGSGTVLRVALGKGFPSTGIDLSGDFCDHMVQMLGTL